MLWLRGFGELEMTETILMPKWNVEDMKRIIKRPTTFLTEFLFWRRGPRLRKMVMQTEMKRMLRR